MGTETTYMEVVGVLGDDPDPLVSRLADNLAERGRVGVVRAGEVDRDPPESIHTTYTIGDGAWQGRGEERSVADVLDRLARAHEVAILVGFPGARIPQIVEGETDVRRTLLRVDALEAVDVDAVDTALEDAREWESLGSLVSTVKRSSDEEFAGAIATFTGRVRARDDPTDERTEHLAFEQYDEVAADRMAEIRAALTARDGVYEVLLHHRTGLVEAGEDIVFVVVLAGHREEAFETVEDGINRLKDEVPIFKKEVTVSDETWVHHRE